MGHEVAPATTVLQGIRREAAALRAFWQTVTSERLATNELRRWNLSELEYHRPGPVNDAWGRSESLDPDKGGDLADEGAGHRA